MPFAEVPRSRGRRRGRGVNGHLGPIVLDDRVIPVVAGHVAQQQDMSRHGRFGDLTFQVVTELRGLAGSGFQKRDTIDIRELGGRLRRRGMRGGE